MPEIDRVFNSIEAHFEVYGDPKKHPKEMGQLKDALTRALDITDQRLLSKRKAGEEIDTSLFDAAVEANNALEIEENQTREKFKQAAELAMVAQRATYPLEGETPWNPLDPRTALFDDEDPYSWSIYDTIAEPIQSLLPPLYQLACEGENEPEGE